MTGVDPAEVLLVAAKFADGNGRRRPNALDREMAEDAVRVINDYRLAQQPVPEYMTKIGTRSVSDGHPEDGRTIDVYAFRGDL